MALTHSGRKPGGTPGGLEAERATDTVKTTIVPKGTRPRAGTWPTTTPPEVEGTSPTLTRMARPSRPSTLVATVSIVPTVFGSRTSFVTGGMAVVVVAG